MNLQLLLLSNKYRWDANPMASEADIAALVAFCPVVLPSEYLELLRLSDGGDAELSGYPSYVRVWLARTAIEYNLSYEMWQCLPGFVGIGDNGGSELVGFDTRFGQPYRVWTIPCVPMTWDDALGDPIDFATFISQLLRRSP